MASFNREKSSIKYEKFAKTLLNKWLDNELAGIHKHNLLDYMRNKNGHDNNYNAFYFMKETKTTNNGEYRIKYTIHEYPVMTIGSFPDELFEIPEYSDFVKKNKISKTCSYPKYDLSKIHFPKPIIHTDPVKFTQITIANACLRLKEQGFKSSGKVYNDLMSKLNSMRQNTSLKHDAYMNNTLGMIHYYIHNYDYKYYSNQYCDSKWMYKNPGVPRDNIYERIYLHADPIVEIENTNDNKNDTNNNKNKSNGKDLERMMELSKSNSLSTKTIGDISKFMNLNNGNSQKLEKYSNTRKNIKKARTQTRKSTNVPLKSPLNSKLKRFNSNSLTQKMMKTKASKAPTTLKKIYEEPTKAMRNRIKIMDARRRQLNSNSTKDSILRAVCPNSNLCLGFNQHYQDLLKDYFDHFLTFKHLEIAKIISKSSVNGMASILKYNKNGYKSDVIMKNIVQRSGFFGVDNLFFEAFVGLCCVNEYNKMYPVFVETYGAAYLKNDTIHDELISNTSGAEINLSPDMFDIVYDSKNKVNVKKMAKHVAKDSHKHVIFTQTVDVEMTLGDYAKEIIQMFEKIYEKLSDQSLDLDKNPDQDFDDFVESTFVMLYRFILCLFQIYHALDDLKDKFVHNDLHTENVLIHKLPKVKSDDATIQYRYQVDDNTHVDFKTPYVPKIIDYGRSFVPKAAEIIDEVINIEDTHLVAFFTTSIYDINDMKLIMRNEKYDVEVLGYDKNDDDYTYVVKFKDEAELFRFIQKKMRGIGHAYVDLDGEQMIVKTGYDKRIKNDWRKNRSHIYEYKNKLGISWNNENESDPREFFISVRKYNGSKDLWLYNIILGHFLSQSLNQMKKIPRTKYAPLEPLRALLYSLFYIKPQKDSQYGAIYRKESGISNDRINNMNDAKKVLHDILFVKKYDNASFHQHYVWRTNHESPFVYANIDVHTGNKPMNVKVN